MHQTKTNPRQESKPPDKVLRGPAGPDALPIILREKMYRAWDVDKAKALEPELEELLACRLDAKDQKGYDDIVAHYTKVFDADLTAKADARRSDRIWWLVRGILVAAAAAAFKVIAAALFPPMH